MRNEILLDEIDLPQINKYITKTNKEIDHLLSKLELKFSKDISSKDIEVKASMPYNCINFHYFTLNIKSNKKVKQLVDCECESSCGCEFSDMFCIDDKITFNIHPQQDHNHMMNVMAHFKGLSPTNNIDFYIKSVHSESENISVSHDGFSNYSKIKESLNTTSLNVHLKFKSNYNSIRSILYKIHIQIINLHTLKSEYESRSRKNSETIREGKRNNISELCKRHSEETILDIKSNLLNNSPVELNILDVDYQDTLIYKVKIAPENKNNVIARVFTGSFTNSSRIIRKEAELNKLLKKSVILKTNKVLDNFEIAKDIENKINIKVICHKGQKFNLSLDRCLEYLAC
jgi:hypothetical protein